MRATIRFFLLLTLAWTIPLAAQQTPYAGNIALPGTLQVENYDNGGEGVAWHDTTAGNAFGVYRFNDMDVGAIAGGGYHLGAIEPGEWAEYTVNVSTTATYQVTLRWASAYPSTTTFRLLLNGADVSGTQSVTSTGGWGTFTTKTFNASLTAGNGKILRINFESGAFNPDYLQFSAIVSCTAPSVSNPLSQEPEPNTTVTLYSGSSGSPAPSGQWYKNGVAIPGQTSSVLTLYDVEQWRDDGDYVFSAANSCGSMSSAPAVVRVKCGNPPKPGLVAENISRALRNTGFTCDWGALVKMNFTDNVFSGMSNNLHPLAAAVAYIKQPIKNTAPTWNMYTFWDTYLRGELGERGQLWYYGGIEIGSYDYHHHNVVAVLAVHYHAHLTGDTNTENLAYRWLRATFLLHALAAVPEQPVSLHAKGQTNIPTSNLVAPYVAMAGERSAHGFWMYRDRNIMFAYATGLYTNGLQETNAQFNVRTFVAGRWAGVYALSDPEKSYLRNIVNNRTLVPYVDGGNVPYLKRDFLGTVHSHSVYKFLGWPRAKGAILTQSHNTNTVATFGAVYFLDPVLRSGREAHFLYPWAGLFGGGSEFKNGVCKGTASLDLPNRLMQAYHPTCPNGSNPIKHYEETTYIYNLPPQADLRYSVTLDPTATVVCTPACP